jgi:hypothetical protein
MPRQLALQCSARNVGRDVLDACSREVRACAGWAKQGTSATDSAATMNRWDA